MALPCMTASCKPVTGPVAAVGLRRRMALEQRLAVRDKNLAACMGQNRGDTAHDVDHNSGYRHSSDYHHNCGGHHASNYHHNNGGHHASNYHHGPGPGHDPSLRHWRGQ
jgi:hypothetical protein